MSIGYLLNIWLNEFSYWISDNCKIFKRILLKSNTHIYFNIKKKLSSLMRNHEGIWLLVSLKFKSMSSKRCKLTISDGKWPRTLFIRMLRSNRNERFPKGGGIDRAFEVHVGKIKGRDSARHEHRKKYPWGLEVIRALNSRTDCC